MSRIHIKVSAARSAAHCAAIAILLAACTQSNTSRNDNVGSVDFNWQVRPILSDNCFKCHGPDAAERKAGLRLDIRESATAPLSGSANRSAIVAGKPAESLLVSRITSADPDEVMPPPSTHKSLAPEEIQLLTQWIDEGANYQPHWAFVAPAAPQPPAVSEQYRINNPIDQFIAAKLQQQDMRQSAETDRATLVDRATLSLTGLPATPEAIATALADTRADWYEQLVNALLATPAYAERMTSMWLDAARFADSDGYLDDDFQRLLYPWRDWVIEAFNDNLPFDEFGTWQLAGDLIPDSSKQQQLATAFGRLHRRNAENGIIDEEYRVEYVIDRTDTLGVAFLGLSVGCARCHDHKFDPISHVDYYSLAAFFNSIDDSGFYPQEKWATGPTLLLTDEATDANIEIRRAEVAAALSTYNAAMQNVGMTELPANILAGLARDSLETSQTAHYPFEAVFADPQLELEYRSSPGIEASQPLRFSPPATPDLRPAIIQAPVIAPGHSGNALFFTANNRGFLGKEDGIGYVDHHQQLSLDFWIYLDKTYPEAAVLNHSDHLRFGSGGWAIDIENNQLAVQLVHAYPKDQIRVLTTNALPVRQWTHLSVTYDGSATAAGLRIYIDGEAATLNVQRDLLTQSMLPTGVPFVTDGFNGIAFGKRWQQSPLEGGAIDELRVFNRELTELEVMTLHYPEQTVATQLNQTQDGQKIAQAFIVQQNESVQNARTELEQARSDLNTLLSSIPEIMTMGDLESPRDSFVLERGTYSNPAEQVFARGLEQIFPWNSNLPRNRMGLAAWLFDPENPLTARVFVNRLWQMHFGNGLVRTAEDFGLQGAAPSHPYLLDWLASEFIASGWDIKAMHRLIVTSATFRQSSDSTTALLEADPDNRYLARSPMRRMPAEVIRDNALAVSGLLNPTLGGPSVFPYQPAGVWEAVNVYARAARYPDPHAVPAEQHRRSLYSMIRRGAPAPSMTIFDFPNRHTSVARRPVSSTPLQALVLLNDPQYVEAARALAMRSMRDHDNAQDQIESIFYRATRRPPEDTERDVLNNFYAAELTAFSAEPDLADEYLQIGVIPIDATLEPLALAALASTASVIMNTPDAYMIK